MRMKATGYDNGTTPTEDNLYSDFLKSIKERDDKVKAYVTSAVHFLYNEGYVTQEEYLSGKSKRLYDIKSYDMNEGMDIKFVFDEREWFIDVVLDKMLNVVKAQLCINGDNTIQVLYERK